MWQNLSLRRIFPGTKTHVMGGHLMFYEYPDEWNRVLEEFFEINLGRLIVF